MPPNKRTYRLQIMLNAEELAVLDAWRFERRMPTRSQAVRELFQRGLRVADHDADRAARSAEYGVLKLPGER
nr:MULTISPECIES: hypothetical protein [unclassified Mesorhizobium]